MGLSLSLTRVLLTRETLASYTSIVTLVLLMKPALLCYCHDACNTFPMALEFRARGVPNLRNTTRWGCFLTFPSFSGSGGLNFLTVSIFIFDHCTLKSAEWVQVTIIYKRVSCAWNVCTWQWTQVLMRSSVSLFRLGGMNRWCRMSRQKRLEEYLRPPYFCVRKWIMTYLAYFTWWKTSFSNISYPQSSFQLQSI